MSISVPLQIGRLTCIDKQSMNLLRNFDIEWRCGSHLIYTMLKQGLPADVIGAALARVLVTYQQMCRAGTADFLRLSTVLGAVMKALRESEVDLDDDQLIEWCIKVNVPEEIREQLIHG